MVRYRTVPLVTVAVLVTLVILTGGVSAAEDGSDEDVFEVNITGTNAPVAEGETLLVNATINNTGGAAGSQQIHLKSPETKIIEQLDMERIELAIVDSIAGPPLTLAPNGSENVTLRWTPDEGDAGNVTLSVQSDDDFPRHTVGIEEGAFFNVSVGRANRSVTAGGTLEVAVNVTNTGAVAGAKRVRLTRDNRTVNATTPHLQPGETRRITLAWDSNETDAGARTLAAVTDSDRAEFPVTVEVAEESTDGGEHDGWPDPEWGSEPVTAETSTPTGTQGTPTTTTEPPTSTPGTAEQEVDGQTDTGGVGPLGGVGALVVVGTIGLFVGLRRLI